MVSAAIRDQLEREIRRMENHLEAMYGILEAVTKEVPKRKVADSINDRIPLIEEALGKIRGSRVFSVKEVTALARRIEPDVDRRVIYNCIKGYLQRSLKSGLFIQVSDTEYKRATTEENHDDTEQPTPRRTQPRGSASGTSSRTDTTPSRRSRA